MDRMTEAAEFKREMNRNYMILKPEKDGNERYAVRMFTDNQIPGFLPFHEKVMNGERRHYYDITSKQPLGRILEYRNLTGGELEKLFSALLFSLKQTERFLLNESCIVLEPDYIYVEPEFFRCFFCYMPGKYMDFCKSLTELSQYLLDHVNYRDGEAVVLAFAVFKECRKANFGIEDIEKCLEKGIGGSAASISSGAPAMPDAVTAEGKQPASAPFAAPDTGVFADPPAPAARVKPESVPAARVKPESAAAHTSDSCDDKGSFIWRLLLAAIMVMCPAVIFALWGIRGMIQYKWILGALEILLGTVLIFVPSVIKSWKAAGKKPEAVEEKWEVYFREEEDIPNLPVVKEQEETAPEPEEMQTVLLTSRPVMTDSRRLISMHRNLEIPMGYFPFIIGKSRDLVDFCLNEQGVSRLHIKIEEADGAYTITDLNSTNGTRINGRLLEANETCSLPLNSEVEIASNRFVFR